MNKDLLIIIVSQCINVVRLCHFTGISDTELIEKKTPMFIVVITLYIFSFKFNKN